jgi:hypothetical protein
MYVSKDMKGGNVHLFAITEETMWRISTTLRTACIPTDFKMMPLAHQISEISAIMRTRYSQF